LLSQKKTSIMRKLLVLLIVIVMSSSGWSQSAEERARAAFQRLDAQRHEEAIGGYEQLLEEGYSSVGLHYNLGLAYYRNEQLGPALLHLEKAHKLAPYDKEVRKNLQLIRNEQEDGMLPLPTFFLYDWWHRVAARLQPDSWGVLALVFLFFGVGLILAWLWFRRAEQQPKWYPQTRALRLPLLGSMLSVLALLFVLFANSRVKALARNDQAVILPASVDVRVAPSEDTDIDFQLHEGLRVRILDDFEGWRKVELVDGRSGWVEREKAETI
jgi:tetratricopeptide (TPR) repeat protein